MQVELEPKNDTIQEMGPQNEVFANSTDIFFSRDKEEKIKAFTEVLESLKKQEEMQKEISELFCKEQDLIFNENDEEIQEIILQIYQILKLNISEGLEKQQFWYYFIDKFLSSNKKNIREESFLLFDDFLGRIDKQKFLKFGVSFLRKINVKINRIILRTLCKKSEEFQFQDFLEDLIQGVDKCLANSSKEIRSRSVELVKVLAEKFGIDLLDKLKNLKKKQKEEILSKITQKNIKIDEKQNQEEILKQKIEQFREEDDNYQNAQPSQILSQFSESWCQEILDLKKWKEKQKKLNEFFDTTQNIQKLDSSISCEHFINLIQRLLKENIIMLQFQGMKLIRFLAKGLRNNFSNKARSLSKILVGKLIDRKHQVIENILKTFEALFLCLKMDDIYNQIEIYNKNRNKDIRINILKLVKIYFDFVFATQEQKLDHLFQKFSPLFNAYYEDKDLEIKQLTNELVLYMRQKLALIKQEHLIYKYINADKIKESGKKLSFSLRPKADSYLSVINSPNQTQSPKNKKKSIKKENKEKNYKFFEVDISIENVQGYIKEKFGEEILGNCLQSNWKQKRQGLQQLSKSIKQNEMILDDIQTRQICTFIFELSNQFNESNLLIINEIFVIFNTLQKHTKSLETLLYFFVQFYVKKVSEKKYQKQLKDHLLLYKEHLEFHIILNLFVKQIDEQTNFKVLEEICLNFQDLISGNFSFVKEDIKKLFKICLNHQHQEVRNSSEEFLRQIAENINFLLEEIIEKIENKNLQQKLQEEFQQIINRNNLELKIIKSKSPVKKKLKKRKSSVNSKKQSKEQNALNYTTFEIYEKLDKGDWKVKKEFLKIFRNHILKNPELMNANRVHETYEKLEQKINDSHRAVIFEAVQTLKQVLDKYFFQMKFFYKKIIKDCCKLSLEKNNSLKEEIKKIFQIFNSNKQGQLVSQSLLKQISQSKNNTASILKRNLVP